MKSLTLRVGDTWPMFLWPAGFAAAAINLAVLPRENWRARIIQATPFWARTSVITGIGFIVIVFFYYVATPLNFISRIDPVGSEAGFDADGGARSNRTPKDRRDLDRDHGLSHQLDAALVFPGTRARDRGRPSAAASWDSDPGMDCIKGHPGLYVARAYDYMLPIWDLRRETRAAGAGRPDLARRGDGHLYAGKDHGLDAELSPPPDTPFFRWRVLALNAKRVTLALFNNSRDKRRIPGDVREICSDGSVSAVALRVCSAG